LNATFVRTRKDITKKKFCFYSRINMVGMQDASKFNMEEGEFFLIKKIDFLFNQV